MSDSKKDLTGIHELSPTLPSSDADSSEDFALDTPSESIDSFENLDALVAPEASDFSAGEELPFNDDFLNIDPPFGADTPLEPDASLEPDAPVESLDSLEPLAPLDAIEELDAIEPEAPAEPEATFEAIQPLDAVAPAEPIQDIQPDDTLSAIREFSEKQTIGHPAVQAEFPFSLRIDGRLAPEEREKLLDLLNRENMGIREMDLDTQFEAGKILIPRISEYAAVLLIQALRGITAKISLSPSDSEYAAREDEHPSAPADTKVRIWDGETTHPADRVKLSTLAALPDAGPFEVIDVLTASASLKSNTLDAESTTEYQELLENLQNEIKRKAFHKGASAVLNYTTSLATLGMPTHYRITVTGTAIRIPEVSS